MSPHMHTQNGATAARLARTTDIDMPARRRIRAWLLYFRAIYYQGAAPAPTKVVPARAVPLGSVRTLSAYALA